jgi:hypothetical protein
VTRTELSGGRGGVGSRAGRMDPKEQLVRDFYAARARRD